MSLQPPQTALPEPPSVRTTSVWGRLWWAFALGAGALLFFLWQIDAHPRPMFDETAYVPAARAWLETGEMRFQEHPPLGKLLIASGIALLGDHALGWRAMSAVFGAVALVGMFFWAWALFRKTSAALLVVGFTLCNQVLYVQARIATLDIFLIAFTTLALAFFTFSYQETRLQVSRRYAVLMGVSLGLAAACKLSGVFLLCGLLGVRLLLGLLRLWKVQWANPRDTDFFSPHAWAAMTPITSLMVFGVIPLAVFWLTYLPQMLHAGALSEFVDSLLRMQRILSGDPGTHPHSSRWFEWPFLVRPVWYLFQVDEAVGPWSAFNPAQAVLSLVNPLLQLGGQAAIGFALYRFVRHRDRNALIVLVAFFSQYLPWALNPKGALAFGYYFFPSVMALGPALGLLLPTALAPATPGRRQLTWILMVELCAACAVVFFFFWPVLSAHVGVAPEGFEARMWLPVWR